ncbi:MAG: hypothetical protein IKS59_03325 [Aeriscardovia sp.]|nr:hypothetical protein [Aeriscardovia sp.]
MQYGPDPSSIYPNDNIKSICYIKNLITRPNIIVGDYTYYDDINGAERFEEHVTHCHLSPGMLYCFRMDIEQNQEAYLNASRASTSHLSFREDGGAARGA